MAENSDSAGGDGRPENATSSSTTPSSPQRESSLERRSSPEKRDRSHNHIPRGPKSMRGGTRNQWIGQQSYENKSTLSTNTRTEPFRHNTNTAPFPTQILSRRGAMPTPEDFDSPASDTQIIDSTLTPRGNQKGTIQSSVDSSSHNNPTRDNESLSAANAIRKDSTVGKAVPMTWAAVVAANTSKDTPKIPSAETREKQQLSRKDSGMSLKKSAEKEKKEDESSHVQFMEQVNEEIQKLVLESKRFEEGMDRESKIIEQNRRRIDLELKNLLIEEFEKYRKNEPLFTSLYKSDPVKYAHYKPREIPDYAEWTMSDFDTYFYETFRPQLNKSRVLSESHSRVRDPLTNLPNDGSAVNLEAPVSSDLAETQPSKSTPREIPTKVTQNSFTGIAEFTDMDEFIKNFPRTGHTAIQELEAELEQLPAESTQGLRKIEKQIQICGKEIDDLYGRQPLSKNIQVEINTWKARRAQLQRFQLDFTTRRSDYSQTGSKETRSADSNSFHTAFSSRAFDGDDTPSEANPISDEAEVPGEKEDVPSSSVDTIGNRAEDSAQWAAVGNWRKPWKGKGASMDEAGDTRSRAWDGVQARRLRSANENRYSTIANPWDNSTQRKALNFDSPTFTPGAGNGTSRATHPTLSSQAAAAAPFTPRAMSATTTPNPQQRESDPISSMNVARIPEFTPSYEMVPTVSQSGANGTAADASSLQYDPFAMSSVNQALPSTPYNPYMDDSNNLAADPMNSYYSAQNNYGPATQPLQYHLYAPQGPDREDLLPYQRQVYDFFIPEKLRENFQRRAEATLQIMPHAQLPIVDPYHSLVALDTHQNQTTNLFGYTSWIYKGLSQKTGHYYCLRRLEGYRATNDRAIRCVKDWRRVDGAHVVKIHDAFTTRAFNDSSLVIVTDYHPLSRTLAEIHLVSNSRAMTTISESVLWSYIVQISLALKEIHQANLAARCIDASKVILTDKNRIRLNACAVLDVVEFELAKPLSDLQQQDFYKFGELILTIATHTPANQLSHTAALDQLSRDYKPDLVGVIQWLISPPAFIKPQKSIAILLSLIALQTAEVLSKLYIAHDTYTAEFFKEIENSRIARLMIKLNSITERPEFAHNQDWSETGDRYVVKLMRDYIFHQVDADGRPNMDLGWILGCLNKLDTGSAEMVELVGRDGGSVFVVSWKEVRTMVARSWGELFGGIGGGGGAGSGGSGGSGGRRR